VTVSVCGHRRCEDSVACLLGGEMSRTAQWPDDATSLSGVGIFPLPHLENSIVVYDELSSYLLFVSLFEKVASIIDNYYQFSDRLVQ
jgi:hypothetical protein